MFADIVMPRGNEKEFIRMAQRLGYGALCFLYPKLHPKHDSKITDSNIDTFDGVLGGFKTINSFRNRAELLVMEEKDDLRKAVENARPDLIFGQESANRSDFIHQRNSGLNHIICRIARDNRVAVGFSLKYLHDSNLRPRVLGRMMQNIRLCRKYGVVTVMGSLASDPYRMRSPIDVISLFVTLGMHPKDAKESMQNVLKIIRNNNERKEPGFIAEGIRLID